MTRDGLLQAGSDLLHPARTVRSAITPLRKGGSRAVAALLAAALLALVALGDAVVGAAGGGFGAVVGDPRVHGAGALLAGALLTALPLALGLRPLVLAAVALPCAAGGALARLQDIALLAFAPAPLAAMVVFLVFTFWVVPDARSLVAGALVGASGAVAATGGPVLVGWGGAAFAPTLADALALAVFVGAPLLATWAFAELGAFPKLRSALSAAAMRDGIFRGLGGAGALLAALWLGARADAGWAAALRTTPLEGLAASAGALVALSLVAALALPWWRGPRWLAQARLAGRIDRNVVAELLLLPAFATLVTLAATAAVPVGAGALAWLAAAAVYAAARWGSTRPPAQVDDPLWILLPGRPDRSVIEQAVAAARAWRTGRVTVLALPGQLDDLAGDHAQCALAAGRLDALRPDRPAQLEDWTAAQPPAWTALPLRELYAAPSLWPLILGERLEPQAQVLLLASPADAGAARAERPSRLVERLRWWRQRVGRALGQGEVVALMVPRALAPRVDPVHGRLADWQSLAGQRLPADDTLGSQLRAMQRATPVAPVRHLTLLCTPAQVALAERVVARLAGAIDAAGSVVDAAVIVDERGAAAMPRLIGLPMGTWRHYGRLSGRLLSAADLGGSLYARAMQAVAQRVGAGGRGDFEIVSLHGDDGSTLPLLPLYAQALASGALARVLELRVARGPGAATPGYSGCIDLPAELSLPALAELAARRLLAIGPLMAGPDSAPAASVGTKAQSMPDAKTEASVETVTEATAKTAVDAPAGPTVGMTADTNLEAEEQAEEEVVEIEKSDEEQETEETEEAEEDGEATVLRTEGAVIVGGVVVLVFDAALDPALRGPLVDAMLLAQLAADRQAPELGQWAAWQEVFGVTLDGLGLAGARGQWLPELAGAASVKELPGLLSSAVQDMPAQAAPDGEAWQKAWRAAAATAGRGRQALWGATAAPPVGRLLAGFADRAPDALVRVSLYGFVQTDLDAAPEVAATETSTPAAPLLRRHHALPVIDAGRLSALGEKLRAKVASQRASMVVDLGRDGDPRFAGPAASKSG